MFWSSVIEGFRLLRHVEIWLGAILVGGLFLAFLLGVPALAKRAGARFMGCLTTVFSIALLPSILNAIYFAFVLPLILGAAAMTPSGVVGAHLGTILYAALAAAGVGFLIHFAPFLPRHGRSAFSTFAQGLIIARMLLDSPFGDAAGVPAVAVRFPSFWLLLAYLATGLALAYLIWTPSLIQEKLRKRQPVVLDEGGEKAGKKRPPSALSFATIPVSTVAAYLPVFMYLQYLLLARLP
jgi:hypothetical protein